MVFPFNDSVFRQPLGSSGSLGLVPRLHGYYELLRIPAARPAALRFLRLAVPPCARLFVSPEGVGTPPSGRGSLGHGFPNRWSDSGDDGASQVPGGPSCAHALLCDPGGTLKSGQFGSRVQPSASVKASASAWNVSGLNHTACVLPAYASQPRSPWNHARLGSGCWPALPGGIGYPLSPIAKFQVDYVMPSPPPRLCLAHHRLFLRVP